MDDIFRHIIQWQNQNRAVALATVLQTWGSSPRGAGAKMAMTDQGEMVGSVSGGCVEGAVIQAAQQVLRCGQPQYLHFGVADETAWAVGLACGGRVDIFVEPVDSPVLNQFLAHVAADEPATRAVLVRGDETLLGRQWLFEPETISSADPLDQVVLQLLNTHQTQTPQLLSLPHPTTGAQLSLFVDVQRPAPRLVIVGAVHIAVELVYFARRLGFHTCVVDPRSAFATPTRFSHADELLLQWPDVALPKLNLNTETAVVMVTHDPKLDDPAILAALNASVRYIGALGSRRTHRQRLERLRAAGIPAELLTRIHAPIGLDLGGRSPAEIALSIMAQIVATFRQGSGV